MIHDLLNADPVAADHFALRPQNDVLHAFVNAGQHVRAALDTLEHPGHLLGQFIQLTQVFAKIFTARSPRDPVSISETRMSMGWVKP